MSILEQARKAVFGETWALPACTAILLGAAVAVRQAAPDAWENAGGPLLLAGTLLVLVALVERGRRS